ncbi:MBL fold metallo-hydrolase [Clostridia bacterium]|nr:MBL fold metallo-hydrolase [Clostridia bacterium]
MIEKITEKIFRIPVTLPKNPLKSLNSYVIFGNTRNLLIDTGFNQEECFADLTAGIRELDLDMRKTDILCTHFHADHTGLVPKIVSPDSIVYMSAMDKEQFDAYLLHPAETWGERIACFLEEGYPADELEATMRINPANEFVAEKYFDCTSLMDWDVIDLGGIVLTSISTPGHTPGHMCFYAEEDRILFTGDHVLFDITPNITSWASMADALGTYLESLEKIKMLDVGIVLTGHRENDGRLAARADALLEHHRVRLEEVIRILTEQPSLTAYEIASHMTWSIRAVRGWNDFPLAQKWFATGEAHSHIKHLILQGKLHMNLDGGVYRYLVKS